MCIFYILDYSRTQVSFLSYYISVREIFPILRNIVIKWPVNGRIDERMCEAVVAPSFRGKACLKRFRFTFH